MQDISVDHVFLDSADDHIECVINYQKKCENKISLIFLKIIQYYNVI